MSQRLMSTMLKKKKHEKGRFDITKSNTKKIVSYTQLQLCILYLSLKVLCKVGGVFLGLDSWFWQGQNMDCAVVFASDIIRISFFMTAHAG